MEKKLYVLLSPVVVQTYGGSLQQRGYTAAFALGVAALSLGWAEQCFLRYTCALASGKCVPVPTFSLYT